MEDAEFPSSGVKYLVVVLLQVVMTRASGRRWDCQESPPLLPVQPASCSDRHPSLKRGSISPLLTSNFQLSSQSEASTHFAGSTRCFFFLYFTSSAQCSLLQHCNPSRLPSCSTLLPQYHNNLIMLPPLAWWSTPCKPSSGTAICPPICRLHGQSMACGPTTAMAHTLKTVTVSELTRTSPLSCRQPVIAAWSIICRHTGSATTRLQRSSGRMNGLSMAHAYPH